MTTSTRQPQVPTGAHMALCPTSGTLEWGTSTDPSTSTLTCRTCGQAHEIFDL